jgi:hypothetical protein
LRKEKARLWELPRQKVTHNPISAIYLQNSKRGENAGEVG